MNLSLLFKKSVENNREFYSALDIVRLNSNGKIWFTGGFLYRTLANELYGVGKQECDFDFIVADPKVIFLPTGWTGKFNKYGNPKLVKDSLEIDLVPLNSVDSIIRRNLEPTIENYLTGTPLTIQSIAYDVEEQKIIGNTGINSLLEKTVGVNNYEQAKICADKKNKTVEQLLEEKAKSLEFGVVSDYCKPITTNYKL